MTAVGFVGLGHMGSVLAANLVAKKFTVVAYDSAGPDRTPTGAAIANDVAELARRAEMVVLSLPDGTATYRVVRQILDAADCVTADVIDTSTIGIAAARATDLLSGEQGVAYIDAPVSAGVAGARARTLAVMYTAADEACTRVQPVLAGLSDHLYRVGDQPGMGQALKLANNFLSATALAATSEAIAFGHSVGLEMATMLEVLNSSSGRSAATLDKFPQHVLTVRFASGFSNVLMAKDVDLYLEAVEDADGPAVIGRVTASVWDGFSQREPGADFTRIYPFVEGS
jgi:3-hydroxyisobutyrate dehydrogenase